jgi:methyl-accepting chemotaxis protein
MLFIAVLSALIIGGIMVFLVSSIIITPLEKVVNVATRVAGGDFDAKINIKSKDEIGQLAGTMEQFKQMMVNTAKDLEKAQRKK